MTLIIKDRDCGVKQALLLLAGLALEGLDCLFFCVEDVQYAVHADHPKERPDWLCQAEQFKVAPLGFKPSQTRQ